MSFFTVKVIFTPIAAFFCWTFMVSILFFWNRLKEGCKNLDPAIQDSLKIAAFLQILHGLAIFIVIFVIPDFLFCAPGPPLISSFFTLGILFHSFFLYLQVFFSIGARFHFITILGRIFLMLGWTIILVRTSVIFINVGILGRPIPPCPLGARFCAGEPSEKSIQENTQEDTLPKASCCDHKK